MLFLRFFYLYSLFLILFLIFEELRWIQIRNGDSSRYGRRCGYDCRRILRTSLFWLFWLFRRRDGYPIFCHETLQDYLRWNDWFGGAIVIWICKTPDFLS